MNYHLKSRHRPNTLKRFIWILFSVSVLLLIVFPGFFFVISSMFAKGTMSIKDRIMSGYDITTSYFTSRNELVKQNEILLKLAKEIDGYKIQNEIYKKENVELKKIRSEIPEAQIIAQVISLPPQTPFDVITVELDAGCGVGDLVYSPSGVFIGIVTEIASRYAKVALLSSSVNQISVENARTGERYELSGRSVGNYIAVLPKDSDVSAHDVLISREGGAIHPVAVIEEIEFRESSSLLTAYAMSPVSIFSLSHVVIKHIEHGVQE